MARKKTWKKDPRFEWKQGDLKIQPPKTPPLKTKKSGS